MRYSEGSGEDCRIHVGAILFFALRSSDAKQPLEVTRKSLKTIIGKWADWSQQKQQIVRLLRPVSNLHLPDLQH